MQVSWIDPDEVRDLLKQLEGPKQSPTASAWEVHTLPAAPIAAPPHESLMSEASPAAAAAEIHPADPPLADGRTGPANAELWRIRERLRVLRDKAQTAGIFSRARPEEPVEATPEPAPEAPAPPPAVPEAPEVPAAEIEAEGEPQPEPPQATVESQPEPSVQPQVAPPPSPVPIESPFELMEPPPPVYEPLFSTSVSPAPEPVVETPAAAATPEPPPPALPAPDADLPFVVSNLGLSDRLNAVAEWVCNRLSTREVLLVDDYGDVLWGAQGQTALVLSAMMAWHSAQRASASATCIDPERIDKPLPPDRSLTVLPLRTRYGVVSLAVIQAAPVGEADATAIRRALTLAVEGPSSTSGNEAA